MGKKRKVVTPAVIIVAQQSTCRAAMCYKSVIAILFIFCRFRCIFALLTRVINYIFGIILKIKPMLRARRAE